MIETISLFGTEISLYYLCWLLALVGTLATGIALRKDFELSVSRSILYVILDFLVSFLLILALSRISGGGKANGFNFIRIVPFIPLFFRLIAYVAKEEFWKISDLLSSAGSIFLAISHLGCIFTGCCHGFPSEWGIYSNVAQTVCFPAQPIEAAVSLAIGLVLCVMVKKKIQRGQLYLWFMTLFGGIRFFMEFFRDNQKVLGNVSELALYALAGMLLGIAGLVYRKWICKGGHKNEKSKI